MCIAPMWKLKCWKTRETINGEPVMPGFVFEVRRRIFALHEPTGQQA